MPVTNHAARANTLWSWVKRAPDHRSAANIALHAFGSADGERYEVRTLGGLLGFLCVGLMNQLESTEKQLRFESWLDDVSSGGGADLPGRVIQAGAALLHEMCVEPGPHLFERWQQQLSTGELDPHGLAAAAVLLASYGYTTGHATAA